MITKRIIPCLDVRHGRVVKGKQFEDIKDIDDPVSLAKYYCQEGADELVFYDITATKEKRDPDYDFIGEIGKEINIPFCVGGGVNTLEDFAQILAKGADKVSINSGAVKNPGLISEAAQKYGNQCVVLSVDLKKNNKGSYDVYIAGGHTNTGLDGIQWIKKGVELGAGEVVVNSMDQDGMKSGFDLELLQKVCNAVSVPVIASGGAGTPEDFYKVATETEADGLLAAGIFHSGEVKLPDLKRYLKDKGVLIRI
ncbi:MAG: imidazole glycerol phosphate synthase subunit HisF [Tissierellia bacterium]|nr:imidazole glycerol phosphate synthase subunit HisF [Tissierellia bacterium]